MAYVARCNCFSPSVLRRLRADIATVENVVSDPSEIIELAINESIREMEITFSGITLTLMNIKKKIVIGFIMVKIKDLEMVTIEGSLHSSLSDS